MISPGTYEFGPHNAKLQFETFREGMAKKVGHDLLLEAGQWQATVEVPDDPTQSVVTASIDTRSINVVQGTGGVKPLSDGDRADIKKNIDKKVLDTAKHPEMTFRSTNVEVKGDTARVDGDLTLVGNTRPVTLDVTLDQGRLIATTSIVQSRWGIKPYSGLMGALKVRDDVAVTIEASPPNG
ncbi:MAG TPA: YceI family protein [Egibacteraceae bacterium]|nr:YceI family protein [Egibacteraceae bacterium]